MKAPPQVWYVPYAALPSVFIPIHTSSLAVPTALGGAVNTHFDRSTAYWAFKELAQFAYA